MQQLRRSSGSSVVVSPQAPQIHVIFLLCLLKSVRPLSLITHKLEKRHQRGVLGLVV